MLKEKNGLYWSNDTVWTSYAYSVPAIPAMTPDTENATSLVDITLMPAAAAESSDSRTARKASPTRLRTRLRASQNSTTATASIR